MNGSSHTDLFILEPLTILPFSFGRALIDSGASTQVVCIVDRGELPINITWSFNGLELNEEPNITSTVMLKNPSVTRLDSRKSMLAISSVQHIHSAQCAFWVVRWPSSQMAIAVKTLSHGKTIVLRLFFLYCFRKKTLKLVSLFIFRH